MGLFPKDYLKQLRKRGEGSHAYKKFQLIGLEIARLLEDEEHKSLYIKLAKEQDEEYLWRIAKEVVERSDIRNKGAYFMRIISDAKKKS